MVSCCFMFINLKHCHGHTFGKLSAEFEIKIHYNINIEIYQIYKSNLASRLNVENKKPKWISSSTRIYLKL